MGNLNEIATVVKTETETVFSDLGFAVLDFRIEGTQFDKDTLERIGKISDVQAEVKAAQIAGINYTEHQQLQAMRDAANNEGGAAGVLMAANAGMANSNMMNQQASASSDDPMANLKKLKDMFKAELIFEDDYAAKKKEILDAM